MGTPYLATLHAAGGTSPYSWSVAAGSLPAGLTLSADGAISGTPGTQGTASFTVQVADSSTPAPEVASAALDIAVAPAPVQQSPNWSGYVVSSGTNLVTAASGEWTVPAQDCAVTPTGQAAIWVGIGGVPSPDGGSSGTLLQTGVTTACSDGVPQDWAWWEEYPSSPNYPATFQSLAVAPGDVIEATVGETTTGAWETRVDDLSTGLSGVMITGEGWGVYVDGSGGSFPLQGSTAGLSYAGGSTAEWIVEDPSGTPPAPLADYGTVTFTDLGTSLQGWYLSPGEAWEIVQGGVALSTPSAPSGSGFSTTYTGQGYTG